jgi:hypothetical protein
LFTDLFELFALLPIVICREFADIQFAPSFIYMVSQPPGNRGNLRVPWINGLVRMAIIARARQYLLNIRRNIYRRLHRVFGHHRRIRFIDPHKLDQGEYDGKRHEHDLNNTHRTKI